MLTLRMRVLVAAAVICAGGARGAWAQDERVPRFAADVRAGLARFKADAAIAASATVTQPTLPTRGLALVGGAHFYALRSRKITVGLGGELLLSGARRTIPATGTGTTSGPTARTHFSAISPQLSFNFGGRNGWSYISGGLGWATFYVDREDTPLAESRPRAKSLNYGGGARWFTRKHVAFSVDLRFYAISPQEKTATAPALPRTKNMVFSAGLAVR